MGRFEEMRAFLPKLVDMHAIDPDDGVDQATMDAALRHLDFLELTGASCPKVFWHGGDAVVFEWNAKAYVTICDDAFMPMVSDSGRSALESERQTP